MTADYERATLLLAQLQGYHWTTFAAILGAHADKWVGGATDPIRRASRRVRNAAAWQRYAVHAACDVVYGPVVHHVLRPLATALVTELLRGRP